MDIKIRSQQTKVELSKLQLSQFIQNNKTVLLAILIPAFFWGWKQARLKGSIKMVSKQLLKYGLLAVASHVKKRLVP